jgi:hypothetical protein
MEAEVRKPVDITGIQQHRKPYRKKEYKMLPKKNIKGKILDMWPSKTEPNMFEILVQWSDGHSIELVDNRLRIGSEFRI